MSQLKVRDFKNKTQFVFLNDRPNIITVERISDKARFRLKKLYSAREENTLLMFNSFHQDLIHVDYTLYQLCEHELEPYKILFAGVEQINNVELSPNSIVFHFAKRRIDKQNKSTQ